MSKTPASAPEDTAGTLAERLAEFVALQRRIVADFGRSLANARQFIEVAGIAADREPDSAEEVLDQIEGIDLPRHVAEQFENFNGVAALLDAAATPPDAAAQAVLADLRGRYEELGREATEQARRVQSLLSGLRVRH
jgi:hypothetical protein